jgi:hypothetical protein
LAAIAISIYAPGLLTVYLGQFGSVVAAGFLAGVVSAGTLKGGLIGAFTAAAFYGVGSAFKPLENTGDFAGRSFSTGAFGARGHGLGVRSIIDAHAAVASNQLQNRTPNFEEPWLRTEWVSISIWPLAAIAISIYAPGLLTVYLQRSGSGLSLMHTPQ